MHRTKIVTSFLKNSEKILLLKRSEKVKSMKNLWAGISGIIEGDEEPFTPNERIIDIGANLGLDFGINDDTKQALAQDAYNKTIDHIQQHLQQHLQHEEPEEEAE